MEENDLFSVSPLEEKSILLMENKKSIFCFNRDKVDNSDEARIQRASERWKNIIKLRHLIASINL